MKYLFLDTNTFLHYKDFEQIDWRSHVADDITIVIPPIIVSEIDKLKDSEKSSKRKKKAKSTHSKLSNYLLKKEVGKYPVIKSKRPEKELFIDDFSRDRNDDVFILSAFKFSNEISPNVVVVSGDLGVHLRAEDLNLEYFEIPDIYLLTEDTDEQKEIIELKNKLREYENRSSAPSLRFNDTKKNLLKIKKYGGISFDDYIGNLINEEKAKYPYLEDEINEDSISHLGNSLSMIYQMRKEDVISYNERVGKYIAEYKEIIQTKAQYEYYDNIFKELNIIIGNEGTSPTGELFVQLEFPSSITLYDDDSIDKREIVLPQNPEIKPNVFSGSYSQIATNMSSLLGGKNEYTKQVQFWNLDNPSSNSIKLNNEKITHKLGMFLELKHLRVDTRNCENFSIKYTIHDPEIPKPVEGSLNIILE